MLKYSDDDVIDDELRELNLQMAVQQYMMQQDPQNENAPLPFQQTQATSQELQKRMTDTYQMGKTPG